MNRHLLIALLLVAATLTVFLQVHDFDFINYDDEDYVVNNPMVSRGLSEEGVRWALTADKSATWQPLTWISLMIDASGDELDAGRFHVTNLVLHTLNALLLYALFFIATRAAWPAALVALLFAVHPLHVESVAWVVERKDVLAVFWGLISLIAYVCFARTRSKPVFGLAVAAKALGLMAKPLLVTWPLVMLLLDWWPMRRLGGRMKNEEPLSPALPHRPFSTLLIEKIPFFLLTGVSSVIAYRVHSGVSAMADLGAVDLGHRIANAAVCYVRYLGMAFWPHDHSVIYPHPDMSGGTPLAAWQIIGSIALLLAISALVAVFRRRRYLTVGWLLYLGTMVPLSGIVQFGTHAMADRFTYVPLIGIFIAVAWLARDVHLWLVNRHDGPGWMVPAVAVVLVVSLILPARTLTAKWCDSITLYEYSLESGPGSPKLHYNLGLAYSVAQRHAEAVPQYRQAIELQPHHNRAWNNLGRTLGMLGEFEEGEKAFQEALRLRPDLTLARVNYAKLLEKAGRVDDALAQRLLALHEKPDPLNANHIGVLWAQQGRFADAIPYFQRALQMKPGWNVAATNLKNARLGLERGLGTKK